MKNVKFCEIPRQKDELRGKIQISRIGAKFREPRKTVGPRHHSHTHVDIYIYIIDVYGMVLLTVPMSVIQSCVPAAPCSAPVPIGVFWDIENCTVPFHKSALGLVQKIRDLFFNGCKEAEFMCVCDTSHQNKDTIQELNDAQVL